MTASETNAARLAELMPEVVRRGGVYDSDAWEPALTTADVDFAETRVLEVGRDTLVLVGQKWLVYPVGRARWKVRKWKGASDEYYEAAEEAEALDDEVARLQAAFRRAKLTPQQKKDVLRGARDVGREIFVRAGSEELRQFFDLIIKHLPH